MRKKSETRKQARKAKEERLKEAEAARKEELKRLKNLKKMEISDQLKQVKAVAGVDEDERLLSLLEQVDLEEDFDPDAFDAKMKEAFGDTYYAEEDEELEREKEEEEKREAEALSVKEGEEGVYKAKPIVWH